MKRIEWHGLYAESWGDDLVPEAYAHPAKYSRGLIRQIYAHMLAEGMIAEGDTVGDPFGGQAGGALDAMRYGLHWRGVELEAKFQKVGQGMDCPGFDKAFYRRYNQRGNKWHELGVCPDCKAKLNSYHPIQHWFGVLSRPIPSQEPHHYRGNIETWQTQWWAKGTAVLRQGDSRQFAELVREIGYDSCQGCPSDVQLGQLNNNMEAAKNGSIQPKKNTKRRFTKNLSRNRLSEKNSRNARRFGTFGKKVDSKVSDRTEKHGSRKQPELQTWEAGRNKRIQKSYKPYKPLRHLPRDTKPLRASCRLRPLQQQPGQSPSVMRVMPSPAAQASLLGLSKSGGNAEEKQRPGGLGAIISSPPYADTVDKGDGPGVRWDAATHPGNPDKISSAASYGSTPGQLGVLDGAVTSPPFEASLAGGKQNGGILGQQHEGENKTNGGAFAKSLLTDYGVSKGNIGNDQGSTFWTAARVILDQLYISLKPGGYAAFVCGDFVRKGKRVHFGRQWLALCEACGFEAVTWAVAWKTEYHGTQMGIFEDVEKRKDRVSFFRRLANEKNPDAAVLNEDVIFMRKPIKEVMPDKNTE